MKNPTIQTKDSFKDAFNAFKQSAQFQSLQDKYTVKPYYRRNRPLKQVVQISSFLLNCLSAVTASACLFLFFNSILMFASISALLAGAFVLVIEALKRLSLHPIFKRFLQFGEISIMQISFVLALGAFSACLSYNGAHQLVTTLTPAPVLQDVSQIRQPYKTQIAKLEAKQADLKNISSWRGKLTRPAQKTYQSIEKQIAEAQAAMMQATQVAQSQNDKTMKVSQSQTSTTAGAFAVISFIFDFLLCVCIWYLEFYDFRSFAEFANIKESDVVHPPTITAHNNDTNPVETSDSGPNTDKHTDDSKTISLAIKQAKANISAYRHKINNNIGRSDTNIAGLEKWERILAEMVQKAHIYTPVFVCFFTFVEI